MGRSSGLSGGEGGSGRSSRGGGAMGGSGGEMSAEEEIHLVDNVEGTLRLNQKEKLFKYAQVNYIWKQMHGVLNDRDVPSVMIDSQRPMELFQGFLDGPVGKGMVGNVFHLTSSTSALVEKGKEAANSGGGGDGGDGGDGGSGRDSWNGGGGTASSSPAVAHYAAKCMRKEDIVAKSAGAQQVLLEIEAMKLMEHPFILQLYCTWQTPTDLVLLLDYMPGECVFFLFFPTIGFYNQYILIMSNLTIYIPSFFPVCFFSQQQNKTTQNTLKTHNRW